MSFKVLVPAHFVAELQQLADVLQVTFVPYDREGRPQDDSSGTAALFRWWLSREQGDRLIETHPQLRWIHTGSAGVDHILTETFLRSGVTLTNSTGVHAQSIAEWVVAAILCFEKDLRLMFQRQSERVWDKVERDELSGKHVVILGSGHIAGEIASRLRSFLVRLTSVRRHAEPLEDFDRTVPVEQLASVLGDADWFVIAVPLTNQTRGMVNDKLLDLLPPRCRIVNVARGEIVDERALVNALRQKRLAGAVLDVFSTEPLPTDHPFWEMDNVLVLPHTTWRSPQVRQKQIALFSENLRRFVAGERLLNVVDVKAGY